MLAGIHAYLPTLQMYYVCPPDASAIASYFRRVSLVLFPISPCQAPECRKQYKNCVKYSRIISIAFAASRLSLLPLPAVFDWSYSVKVQGSSVLGQARLGLRGAAGFHGSINRRFISPIYLRIRQSKFVQNFSEAA